MCVSVSLFLYLPVRMTYVCACVSVCTRITFHICWIFSVWLVFLFHFSYSLLPSFFILCVVFAIEHHFHMRLHVVFFLCEIKLKNTFGSSVWRKSMRSERSCVSGVSVVYRFDSQFVIWLIGQLKKWYALDSCWLSAYSVYYYHNYLLLITCISVFVVFFPFFTFSISCK